MIRVIKRGESLIKVKLRLDEIILQAGWDELSRHVASRLVRIFRIKDCPLIYLGSTDNIKLRFKDLAGRRHTVFFPILTLMLSKWRLDYGFKMVSSKKEAGWPEGELKKNTGGYTAPCQHLLRCDNSYSIS